MRYWVSSAPKIGGMSQSGRRQNRQNRVNNVELFHVFRLFRTPPPSWSIRCFWSTRGKYLQQSWKCFRSFAPLGIYFGDVNLFSEYISGKKFNLGIGGSTLISEYFLRKYIDLRMYLGKVDPRRGLHFVFIYQSEEEQRLCCLLKIHLGPTSS